MKAIQAIKLGGALIVAFSVSAWAQGNETGTAPATSQSSKQANYALEKKVRAALDHAKDSGDTAARASGGCNGAARHSSSASYI